MNESERKIFCQYRKSCYKTGIRANINDEMESNFSWLWRPTSGWFNSETAKTDRTEAANEVYVKPTTVKELKLFCKYRSVFKILVCPNIKEIIGNRVILTNH